MDLLPLCGPPVDSSGLVPPGPSYMTPHPCPAGEGSTLAVEGALAALSRTAAAGFAAQLQLDDLAEELDEAGDDVRPKLVEARQACSAARRSLRLALLAMADLRDRLVPPSGGPAPPHPQPRRPS